MHLLILGGSREHPGGVEAFCDRAIAALGRRDGWRVNRIFTGTAYLNLRRLPDFAASIGELVRYRRERPDCVWLQYHAFPDLALLAIAKLIGMRVVVTPHLGANWRSQSDPLLRWLSGNALKPADLLALLSPTQELEVNMPASVPRALIRTFLPHDVLVQPLPAADTAPPTMRLVHAGRLSEGKGTFLVVEICARLRDAGVSFSAEIIGSADPETFDRLEQLIVDLGLQDHLRVLRWLPVNELLERLRAADVLIHPSHIDSYPLIVLEGLASGAIPICLRLAGASDMVDSYDGHIVGPEHPVEDVVAWLLSQDLANIRRRGRVAAEKVRADYDWDHCAALAEEALSARPHDGRRVLPGAANAPVA
jgi:glycosyltransferase involved in cell wall biosynthesis